MDRGRGAVTALCLARDHALRAAAEVAPDDVRAVLGGQLALIERGRGVGCLIAAWGGPTGA